MKSKTLYFILAIALLLIILFFLNSNDNINHFDDNSKLNYGGGVDIP